MIQTIDSDKTTHIVRSNLKRIREVAVAGNLLSNDASLSRIKGLLDNYQRWGLPAPHVMFAVHDDQEHANARHCASGWSGLADFRIVRQQMHTQTAGNAIDVYRAEIDSDVKHYEAKRHILLLVRRGGKGTPKFISPFLEGQGTTCGEWTRPVDRKADGSVTKGFMKANVAVGFCPVECPFCYLQMWQTDGMNVVLNLEDLAEELQAKWYQHPYPINFCETSGLVEYDEWFASANGDGSIVQSVIDSCKAAEVTPFFLTKIRFPRYLKFDGKVQVGISLMPEEIRRSMAPNGSPTDELLESLAWAVSAGAVDPVIRLAMLWKQKDRYSKLLEQMRDRLGTTGWRLTLDVLRFSPNTAITIANRHPEAADVFAAEIGLDGRQSLDTLAKEAKRVKKLRPSVERQDEIYRWVRSELDRIGCQSVPLTACKGDPQELLPLVRDKTILAMPCACYGCSRPERQVVHVNVTPR